MVAVESGISFRRRAMRARWTVLEVRHGMALLEHADGHRLSRRTTTLTVVRKAEPGARAARSVDDADSGDSPTLFD